MGSFEIENISIYDTQCLPQTRWGGLIFLIFCYYYYRSVKLDFTYHLWQTQMRACVDD